MNLTLTQAFHRTQTLSGELKAAESALTDCEDDAKAKERIASIAAEAVEKAKANLQALKDERAELAEHMKTLALQVGDAHPIDESNSNRPQSGADEAENQEKTTVRTGIQAIDETEEALWAAGLVKNSEGTWYSPDGPNTSEPFADFGHPTQNGLDDSAVTAAFDRSTHP